MIWCQVVPGLWGDLILGEIVNGKTGGWISKLPENWCGDARPERKNAIFLDHMQRGPEEVALRFALGLEYNFEQVKWMCDWWMVESLQVGWKGRRKEKKTKLDSLNQRTDRRDSSGSDRKMVRSSTFWSTLSTFSLILHVQQQAPAEANPPKYHRGWRTESAVFILSVAFPGNCFRTTNVVVCDMFNFYIYSGGYCLYKNKSVLLVQNWGATREGWANEQRCSTEKMSIPWTSLKERGKKSLLPVWRSLYISSDASKRSYVPNAPYSQGTKSLRPRLELNTESATRRPDSTRSISVCSKGALRLAHQYLSDQFDSLSSRSTSPLSANLAWLA